MQRDYNIDLEELIYDKSLISKLYQSLRVVDPIAKKVMHYSEDNLAADQGFCFGLWGKNDFCQNCISMRSYNEQKVFIKMECLSDKIYMITAVPVEYKGRKLVLELIRDVRDSFVTDSRYSKGVVAKLEAFNLEVVKDSLTGAFNRRYIDERLPAEIAASLSSGQPLSIIMADLDYFKRVNDSHGHQAGDLVLREFSKKLKSCLVGQRDWVARYGGEEFIVFLANASLEQAVQAAEKMRVLVEQRGFIYNGKMIKITSSFGVCSVEKGEKTTPKNLIECADKKLYQAKNQGRNMVVG